MDEKIKVCDISHLKQELDELRDSDDLLVKEKEVQMMQLMMEIDRQTSFKFTAEDSPYPIHFLIVRPSKNANKYGLN